MKYVSSRGQESNLTFEQVLFSGYASDGGLYFPEKIPLLSKDEIEQLSGLSYPDMVKKIMPLFISEEEIPQKDLDKIIDNAFKKFSVPEVIKIKELKNGLKVAELFHGPTLAFKDLALGVVGGLYNYFLERSKKKCIVIVGTSGDTGSAAISAVRGLPMIDIIVLLPGGRCTKIQQLQMTTVHDANIHNFVVDGTSDDLDMPIKEVFLDAEFVKKHNLCSINSINWARIMVQTVHYFYCYFQCRLSPGYPVNIIVPTGAAGNIASGFVARKMGIPINLIATVNPNDIVHRTFKSGDYSLAKEVRATWASAMDIQVPYNIERILLMAADMDFKIIKKIMAEFEAENYGKGTKVPKDLLAAVQQVITDTMSFDDTEIEETIKVCHDANDGYILCPHTAVAVKYYYKMKLDQNRTESCICIATASPAKFPEAIQKSGVVYVNPPEIQKLFELEEKFENMDRDQDILVSYKKWEQILRKKIESISSLS